MKFHFSAINSNFSKDHKHVLFESIVFYIRETVPERMIHISVDYLAIVLFAFHVHTGNNSIPNVIKS